MFLISIFFQGIVIGLENLDGVIHIIRETSSHAMASVALMNGIRHGCFDLMFFWLMLEHGDFIPFARCSDQEDL